MSENKINIRPNVSMLSVLKFLEYETWFALAEFVDNAIASYLNNEKALKQLHGEDFQLEVIIEINDPENKITIRDNAGGIEQANYSRAFRAAEILPDTSGLSEFGMGMKSASCWFSDLWTVRTKALNETVEKTVKFDMNKIFEDKLEELEFTAKAADKNHHYTIIELLNVNKMPRRKGLGKVKSHLASIYREFLRKGILKLIVDNTELQFAEPNILIAPKYDDPNGEKIKWKREINFGLEDGLSVKGFVGIRETGSTAEAGFALFRRGRVIEGSFDNGFRPEFIFGAPNSYRYQRVFGELHLEGFDVSFTKKGIQWDENLDVFLQCLKDELSHDNFPLLTQAEKFRARANDTDYRNSGIKALSHTVSDFEQKAPEAIKETFENPIAESEVEVELPKTEKRIYKSFKVNFNKINWLISIELSYDTSLNDLLEVGPHLIKEPSTEPNVKQIGIRLSLTHPFMVEYAGTENGKIEPILKMAAAMGLAEIIAKESGAKTQGEIRRNFNQLITKYPIKTMNMKEFAGKGNRKPQLDIPISIIDLDPLNPRIVSYTNGNKELSQIDLISILYEYFDTQTLAMSLTANGYFDEEPIIVVPNSLPEGFLSDKTADPDILAEELNKLVKAGEIQFTVVEGNRRVSTLKLLLNSDLREKIGVEKSYPSTTNTDIIKDIEKIPCIIYLKREDVSKYLGVRHISGLLKWEAFAKAAYINETIESEIGRGTEDNIAVKNVQDIVGDRSDTIRKQYIAYKLFIEARDDINFDVTPLRNNFSLLTVLYNSPGIRDYMNVSSYSKVNLKERIVAPENLQKFENVLTWIFGNSKKGEQPILTDSRNITNKLSYVVNNESARNYLIKYKDLDGAFEHTNGEKEFLSKNLTKAARAIQTSLQFAFKYKKDEDLLKQVQELEELLKALKSNLS